MARKRTLFGIPLVLLMACSSAGSPDDAPPVAPPIEAPDAGGEAATITPLAPPVFGKCPKYYGTECAQMDVLLDHQNASGESIKLHIARQKAKQPATRQLWLLSGGPGQAGESWYGFLRQLAPALPDTDIYVVDHRGTGYSHRLTCSQQDVDGSGGGYSLTPDDVPACLKELKASGDYARLPYFTTQQAARDVVSAIHATRTAGQKTYLWGGSYGTHWAHRVLQVAPDVAEGIVFDGFITPGRVSFVTDVDKSVDEAGKAYAAGCTADPSCGAHLGGDALAKTKAILAGLDAKPCAGGKSAAWRSTVSSLMDSWSGRAFIFPLLHRLERCSVADQTAIKALVSAYNASGGEVQGIETPPVTDTYRSSAILQYNIVLSELWNVTGHPDPTHDEIVAAAAAQTFLAGTSSYAATLADVRKIWPVAPNDWKDLPVPVKTKTRMLWLSGGLDTRTPAGESKLVTELYDPQSFVLLPGAAHTPALSSPLASAPKQNCGTQIALRFVGEDRLDTSCVSQLRPVLYESPTAAFATSWWGTADDWGDGTPKPAAHP